jgi:sensor histidine kinase regulating citrate/malate metabolism
MNPFVAAAALLLAAVFLFGLVRRLTRGLLSRFVDRRILNFQNELITRHCAEVEHIYGKMRSWRHDYHNHIQALKAHMALGQYAEINAYLSRLDADLTGVDTVYKTGNTMVDAILNSKISVARSKGISVNAKATVPSELFISEVDLCVIIGNLIDNAAEACGRLGGEAEKVIRLYMDSFKEQLYISVSNTSGGEIKKEGSKYLTTKGANHGFGLKRVDEIVDKYGGWVNRQHEDGVFATEVMIYPISLSS